MPGVGVFDPSCPSCLPGMPVATRGAGSRSLGFRRCYTVTRSRHSLSQKAKGACGQSIFSCCSCRHGGCGVALGVADPRSPPALLAVAGARPLASRLRGAEPSVGAGAGRPGPRLSTGVGSGHRRERRGAGPPRQRLVDGGAEEKAQHRGEPLQAEESQQAHPSQEEHRYLPRVWKLETEACSLWLLLCKSQSRDSTDTQGNR